MATSAFKSTTKRTPLANDKSSSTSSHRRLRSLSRFSRRIPPDDFSDDAHPPPFRGRFVNTVRGSGVPDISLDDLAIQLFSSGDRGGSAPRKDDISDEERVIIGSQRRGRSVSRHGSENNNGCKSYSSGGGKLNSDGNNSSRRRSVSVVRYQISDSESDRDHSQNSRSHANLKHHANGNNQVPLSNKAVTPNHKPGLRRSFSQKDLKYHDGYSSHSSSLTDDEGRDAHSNKNGFERTIRTVYAQKAEHPTSDNMNGGLYEAMRKELRHAVEEIRMELEQSMGKSNPDSLLSNKADGFQAAASIRRNYSTKLEQSVKHKQDLLAEIVLEEQRGRELSKIVKELLTDPKNTVLEKPTRARKRSNDRSRMSKRLTEAAEKYIEDFISNVEDTDISSLDGERSDASSTLGGMTRAETFRTPPPISKCPPVEMDGIVLPWLQWETSNDSSPLSDKKKEPKSTPKSNLWDAAQEATPPQELSMHSISSRGSWSPGPKDSYSTNIGEIKGNNFGEVGSYQSPISFYRTRLQFDIDEYLKHQSEEDFLFERWKQQQRIHSGGLLLCNQMFF